MAVITAEKAIEIYNKPFAFHNSLSLKLSSLVTCVNKTLLHTLLFIIHVKIISCNNFSGDSLPMKIFNNNLFPDYGIWQIT